MSHFDTRRCAGARRCTTRLSCRNQNSQPSGARKNAIPFSATLGGQTAYRLPSRSPHDTSDQPDPNGKEIREDLKLGEDKSQRKDPAAEPQSSEEWCDGSY